jgi:hypothetical protein
MSETSLIEVLLEPFRTNPNGIDVSDWIAGMALAANPGKLRKSESPAVGVHTPAIERVVDASIKKGETALEKLGVSSRTADYISAEKLKSAQFLEILSEVGNGKKFAHVPVTPETMAYISNVLADHGITDASPLLVVGLAKLEVGIAGENRNKIIQALKEVSKDLTDITLTRTTNRMGCMGNVFMDAALSTCTTGVATGITGATPKASSSGSNPASSTPSSSSTSPATPSTTLPSGAQVIIGGGAIGGEGFRLKFREKEGTVLGFGGAEREVEVQGGKFFGGAAGAMIKVDDMRMLLERFFGPSPATPGTMVTPPPGGLPPRLPLPAPVPRSPFD